MAFSINQTSGGDGLSSKISSEINITPLIDVLLVLPIIFMVIVPETPRGLHSALPPAATRGADSEAKIGSTDRPVFVQVKSGPTAVRYMVDGAGVERTELTPRLLQLFSQTPARQVLVKADASLDFGVIAGVIDAGQAAGAESVGLVTPQIEKLSR